MPPIPVEEAVARITSGLKRLPTEAIPLLDALGRVLAQDVEADRALPAHPTSSMDGFAVRAADAAHGPSNLKLVGDVPAGIMPSLVLGPGETARIMTGAIVPSGADAVVPVEDTEAHWDAGEATALGSDIIIHRSARIGDFIRPVGDDLKPGQQVLAAGTTLRPPDIGLLAVLGHATVPVVRQPRVAILSTGDELTEPGQPLAPGHIYDSNAYALATVVRSWGAIPVRVPPARDTLDSVRAAFHAALAHSPDLILSSAGVSVGAYDVVRTVIDEFGAVDFWRVNVRPGKPLAFGHIAGVPMIGLPGNPVSALVTAELFVRPALAALGGWTDLVETVRAAASEALHSDGRRTYVRVILRRSEEGWTAITTGTQSSSAILSLVLADGLLIIPDGVTEVAPGMLCTVRLLRPLPAAAE
ncbi:MAG: gephyrin-like molybdotransferase Glp [Anaerolineae bacterium]